MRAFASTQTSMTATSPSRALAAAATATTASHLPVAPRALLSRRRRAFRSPMSSARASSAAQAPTAPSPSSSTTLSSTAVDAPGAAAAAAIFDEAPAKKTPWWEKHDPLPNIVSVSSVHELLEVFAGAGDKLVLIDVYAEWCNACRGISQKVFSLARDRPDDLVLVKLNFDANKQLAKTLGVRALPSFALFRGADGKLDLFTAGPARAAVLREKVERYGAPRCYLSGKIEGYEPSPELRELLEKQQAGKAEENK